MVKTLVSYVGKKHVFYSGMDAGTFKTKIISEKDIYGSIKYFRVTNEKGEKEKERIFVTGKNRIIFVNGAFVEAKNTLTRRLYGCCNIIN